jgi:glutamate--cysteine ligase
VSQYLEGSSDKEIIQDRSELVAGFHQAGKLRRDWRIGTEYETVGVFPRTGRAVPYSGQTGIEAFLRRLAASLGWEPLEEDGHVVALRGGEVGMALEPGGQVELSGGRCETIHESADELRCNLKEMVHVAGELGFVLLQLGMQPFSPTEEIEWVPKTRYRLMAPYMETVGVLGHRMMKQTAAIQVNFDYSDEADAMEKFRAAMGIVPIVSAMFANSPICDGGLNGFLSMRGHIWTDTDARRSGLLPFAFTTAPSFEEYVEYALDVPMYFIVREGRWIDMTGTTFRTYLEKGREGQLATMGDWEMHLTTLFPEVRIKTYLEIRCIDNQPLERMLGAPALCKGIFHETDAVQAAWDTVRKWSWEERLEAYAASHRVALAARVRGISLRDLARELILIATEGLVRQDCRNEAGESEAIYLERLREDVAQGRCPAVDVAENWKGPWNYDPRRLVDGTAYRFPGP